VVRSVPDYVQRRVIVEFGRRYIYATLTDANGKIHAEELWKQPYMLDAKDANEEAHEAFQAVYQHIQDTVVFPTNSSGDSKPD
jgi:hypothetical protein